MLGFGVAAAIKVVRAVRGAADVGFAGGAAQAHPGRPVALGGVALTVCLQGRWRDTPWMVAGVLVAFGSHELTKPIFPPDGSAFLATFLLGRWPSSSTAWAAVFPRS